MLIPDCKGDPLALAAIFESRPDILNHNLETVARLQRLVRPSASYVRSLAVLGRARAAGLVTKSGLIVGMGESEDEVLAAMADLRNVGVDILTVGQYLRPTADHLPVARWWTPDEFARVAEAGRSLGFAHVEASPLTRSSYHARQAAEAATRTPLKSAVLWLRRDLRLADHPALLAALAAADEVVPLFVVDPVLERTAGGRPGWPSWPAAWPISTSARMAGWWCAGGRRSTSWPRWRRRSTPPRCSSPTTSARTAPTGTRPSKLRSLSMAVCGWSGSTRPTPWLPATSPPAPGRRTRSSRRSTGAGGPTGGRLPPLNRPSRGGRRVSTASRCRQAPDLGATTILPPGEAAGLRRLDEFADRAASYAAGRNVPGEDHTSRLSPYLRFGCLHPRQVLAAVDDERFRTEVAWREFYAAVLAFFPDSARSSFRPEMAALEVDTGPDADRRFDAWVEGRTGYPIVDAGMRQLAGEAWMHNRVRMITASFLVKDLHLDWRRGARLFMARLQDGDLASNQHNWQWVAGTGTDPAPFFRIFNPTAQGKKFDPDGTYVRQWVPELPRRRRRPRPRAVEAAGRPARRLPEPIVDHAEERRDALARYGRLRARKG